MRISVEDPYRIRRAYRRLAKLRGRGHLHQITVFIRHENVVRLLEFLEVLSGGVATDLVNGSRGRVWASAG